MWGLVPLYWKQLQAIEAVELIAHRVVWSLLFVAALLRARGGFGAVRAALGAWRLLPINLLSSLLLSVNWLVYVWAVNRGQVIECSLGYFLTPLLSVVLGRFVLREHLRRWQWFAVGLAAVGVMVQLAQLGRLPWIALALAASFSLYGLLRKQSALGPLIGLAVETALLAPVAALYLLWRYHAGTGALGQVDLRSHLLILSAGVITTIPLLCFAVAARRMRLVALGVLSYLGPTCQFAIGLFVYGEPFSRQRAVSFVLIWTGLALYTADALWTNRRS
jgi:chloramphenicol-sensitive protein RarD